MKKVIALSIALITLFSCSKDESPKDPIDPIIGKWRLFSENGKEVTGCKLQSSVTFNENGTYTSNIFIEYDNRCIENGSLTAEDNPTWKNLGNEKYSFAFNGKTIEFSVFFSDNENTLNLRGEIYKRI